MLIASLALGFKKCSITNEGITKKIYVLPFLKKIKTWREIKHLAHVIFVTKNKRKKEKSCTNLLGFIDHNDKILLTIEDRTKKSRHIQKKTRWTSHGAKHFHLTISWYVILEILFVPHYITKFF